VQKVLQKLTTRIGKEKFFSLVPSKERRCPFFAKNMFLVITFEWKVCFG
jgi:hypothetical protein